MPRTLQLVLAGTLLLVFGLSALSRRFPHVRWLQAFRYERPQLTEKQRERWRRRGMIHSGIELILMGLVLPMGYAALTVMMFNDFQHHRNPARGRGLAAAGRPGGDRHLAQPPPVGRRSCLRDGLREATLLNPL